MPRGIFLALAIVSAHVPHSVSAKEVLYVCDFNRGEVGGWMPEKVFVSYETKDSSVLVADPVIYHFNNKQPLVPRVGTDNAKRLSIAWDIDARDNAGNRAVMTYSLTIRKAEMKASMSARVNAFNFAKSTGGDCKLK